MAFKASKINIDLELDLTEFIPEEKGGILKTKKVNGDDIFEWTKMTVKEAENLTELQKEINAGNGNYLDITIKSKESVIKQIDYFYGKGQEFYDKLHLSTLKEMLEYIREQVSPVKKNSRKSKK